MDHLTINDLEVWTRIGVPEEERHAEQKLLVSIALPVDVSASATRDAVEDSIDYADIVERVKDLAGIERKTIERFAEDVAAAVLQFPKATQVTVTVTKFPPLPIASASVTIERSR